MKAYVKSDKNARKSLKMNDDTAMVNKSERHHGCVLTDGTENTQHSSKFHNNTNNNNSENGIKSLPAVANCKSSPHKTKDEVKKMTKEERIKYRKQRANEKAKRILKRKGQQTCVENVETMKFVNEQISTNKKKNNPRMHDLLFEAIAILLKKEQTNKEGSYCKWCQNKHKYVCPTRVMSYLKNIKKQVNRRIKYDQDKLEQQLNNCLNTSSVKPCLKYTNLVIQSNCATELLSQNKRKEFIPLKAKQIERETKNNKFTKTEEYVLEIKTEKLSEYSYKKGFTYQTLIMKEKPKFHQEIINKYKKWASAQVGVDTTSIKIGEPKFTKIKSEDKSGFFAQYTLVTYKITINIEYRTQESIDSFEARKKVEEQRTKEINIKNKQKYLDEITKSKKNVVFLTRVKEIAMSNKEYYKNRRCNRVKHEAKTMTYMNKLKDTIEKISQINSAIKDRQVLLQLLTDSSLKMKKEQNIEMKMKVKAEKLKYQIVAQEKKLETLKMMIRQEKASFKQDKNKYQQQVMKKATEEVRMIKRELKDQRLALKQEKQDFQTKKNEFYEKKKKANYWDEDED